MNDQLKNALDQIRAEEQLKMSARAYLAQKTRGYSRSPLGGPAHKAAFYSRLAVSAACVFFALLGGRYLYFTPTAEISIDINPSIELGVNRFDQVISVDSYNEDGAALIQALRLKHTNYADAVDQILSYDPIATLLSDQAEMTIAVIGDDDAQSVRILSRLETCAAEHQNANCYFMPEDEANAAHETGLSCGKYRAFLQVQTLDPSITPEKIQQMSMREIRDYMITLSSDETIPLLPEDSSQEYPIEGQEHLDVGHGHGHGATHE